MGKNKRNRKRGTKKPPVKDQVADEPGSSGGTLAAVQLEKGAFSFGQKLDAGPSDAAASACPMDTATAPTNVVGAAASTVADGFNFNSHETVNDQLKYSQIVGASSFPSQTGGGHGASESPIAFKPIVSPNRDVLRYDKPTVVQVADKVKTQNGDGELKKSAEKRGKRKFEDTEDIDEKANGQHYTQFSIVAEHNSSMARKTAEKIEREYQSTSVRSSEQKVTSNDTEKKVEKKPVYIKSASQIEAESNKENNKAVWEAERREFERKMVPYKLSNLSEVKYQQYLANQASILRKSNEATKRPEVKVNKKDNIEKVLTKHDVKLETKIKQERSKEIDVALATQLGAECQKLNNVRAAGEAETRYWEKSQDNSHGKKTTRSTSKEKKLEFPGEVQKELKKVRVVNEEKEVKKNEKNLKSIPRRRATKSMSEHSDYQKKEDLRKMRSTSSMSDIQNNTDDVKLTYAEMVIKGEQDRTARFEATLAGYLSAEYKNISRLQSALMCEAAYQKTLVEKNDFTSAIATNKENIDMKDDVKKSQRRRQKSRSKSKEAELHDEEDVIKKEAVKEVKSSRQVNRSLSHDQECQTDQKSYEDRCAEMVTLPMEADFTKRLKEEMSHRASAETMVRMLETETTEQRHMLAGERGKIAKLEALVIHLESEVKEKTLIADEYKSRLEETEKQLQEANERIIKLETNTGSSGQYISSTDYMFMGHEKDKTIEQSLKIRELQDEIQRYKDELEIARMEAQPGMMSVLEHQDILQVVELRAQQAEIKALQLENEILKLKNTKEAWSAASPSHVTANEPRNSNSPHGEFSLSAASLFSGLPGLDIQPNSGSNQSGAATSTFQLPSFFTSPTGSGGISAYNLNPSSELQFGSAFTQYDPSGYDPKMGTGGSVQKGGGGEFESLSSESDWSISDDEPGSTKPGKNKKSTAALSDQENLPVGGRQKYSTRKKKPPLPPKPKPKVGPKPGGVKIPSSVQRLGVPLMVVNTNGVSTMHASTVESEEAVSFDQRPQEAKLRVPKRVAGPRGRRRPKLPS